MNIGSRIKSLRQLQGLTQKELAEKIHKSSQVISNWERGYTPNITNDDIVNLAKALSVQVTDIIHCNDDRPTLITTEQLPTVSKKDYVKRIPVLGAVRGGVPIDAIEDIEDWEEIDTRQVPFRSGTFFALRVVGDSMEPTLREGDIVIVRQQPRVENGEIGIVAINGDTATVKEVKESSLGITLIGHNAAVYTPHFYDREEVESLPLRIIGKVVELRRKF